MQYISANIVDLISRTIFFAKVHWDGRRICKITRCSDLQPDQPYLIPGFVDAHVHIESSMLVPDEFAYAAVQHGTLACVSDPHEIANVLGIKGIDYMIERAGLTPFKILFGAPSCVPATPFETAGATITADDIKRLIRDKKVGYLSEMMNFPGVINGDDDVIEKLNIARQFNLPVDGHAPGLTGDAAKRYAAAGISTDHECISLKEASDKIACGMKILLREGSAAKNFNALHPLLKTHPESVMFCSDDKHPDDLVNGHIKSLVKRALALGYDLFDVLSAASLNPVSHYRLPLGLLQRGDFMDALLVNNLSEFTLQKAWIEGKTVFADGLCCFRHYPVPSINNFHAHPVLEQQLNLAHIGAAMPVIVASDGQLWTEKESCIAPNRNGLVTADIDHDLLFITVYNRYSRAQPSIALIKGFGLKSGAIASSVSHDSHNIVAVGTDASSLAKAINAVIATQGGLSVADNQSVECLPLPVAGLMSDQPAETVAPKYKYLTQLARKLGSRLTSPFMTLSFMALLVIPKLKLSDKGLFDGESFQLLEQRT
jgi:adenine deaminase